VVSRRHLFFSTPSKTFVPVNPALTAESTKEGGRGSSVEDTFKPMGETASKMKDSRPRILIKEERQDLTAVA
jgi:hypothetical protein